MKGQDGLWSGRFGPSIGIDKSYNTLQLTSLNHSVAHVLTTSFRED